MTSADYYKAVSDLISDSYDWLSDKANEKCSIQYILGLNDMARYLVEINDGVECVHDKEKEKSI